MQVFVTNHNEFVHVDKFDGVEYIWEPGQKQLVDEAAAAHMFGFGRADKTENLVRIGWQNLPGDEGVMRLAKFVFTQGMIVESPVEEAEEAPVQNPIIPENIAVQKPFRKKSKMGLAAAFDDESTATE